ncbi:phosphopantetheine-binding protein [Alteriqipengyuania sp.]|uniref:phosphopantetheine-binding protein n=1 Tax=Alteriqipengyuania sp. TaxID=2800692 RepID=UPI003512F7CE
MSAQISSQADQAAPARTQIDETLRAILRDVLGLSAERAEDLTPESGLFGHLPELDSQAVADLLTEMEDRFDIIIEDDEIDGDHLETYGGLLALAEAKCVTR